MLGGVQVAEHLDHPAVTARVDEQKLPMRIGEQLAQVRRPRTLTAGQRRGERLLQHDPVRGIAQRRRRAVEATDQVRLLVHQPVPLRRRQAVQIGSNRNRIALRSSGFEFCEHLRVRQVRAVEHAQRGEHPGVGDADQVVGQRARRGAGQRPQAVTGFVQQPGGPVVGAAGELGQLHRRQWPARRVGKLLDRAGQAGQRPGRAVHQVGDPVQVAVPGSLGVSGLLGGEAEPGRPVGGGAHRQPHPSARVAVGGARPRQSADQRPQRDRVGRAHAEPPASTQTNMSASA